MEGVLANTSNIDRERAEGTVFYRRRVGDWLRRYVIELVLVALFAAFLITTTVITAGARTAFREAKDIRTALKFVGTQYYGQNSCIYDPSKIDGLKEGAADDIAAVSTRYGKVFLYAWDENDNEPLRFEYRKGFYTVTYIADKYTGKTSEDGRINQMMGHWDVTYSFNVLNYDSE